MKKIGILTFHYVDNYGAVLQAWALRTALNRMNDIHAEIINYIPNDYKIRPYIFDQKGISAMEGKRRLYEKFLVEKCGMSESCTHTVSGMGFDYCCVGSDQVWNMAFRENITHEYLFPNLNDNITRFSYAASIGGKIKGKDTQLFREHLSKFNAVSVREECNIDELKKAGISDVISVVDPTLLLSEDDYSELIEEPEYKPENYVFFFSYPIGEDMRRYAPYVNRLAIENNLNVLHSFPAAPQNLFVHNYGSMMYEGIGQFLWYMKNASVIVTTSYHGAIFGKMFSRPTYILCRETGKERFEQLDKVLNHTCSFVRKDWMTEKWDIGSVTNKSDEELEKWKEKSLSFLRSVIDG